MCALESGSIISAFGLVRACIVLETFTVLQCMKWVPASLLINNAEGGKRAMNSDVPSGRGGRSSNSPGSSLIALWQIRSPQHINHIFINSSYFTHALCLKGNTDPAALAGLTIFFSKIKKGNTGMKVMRKKKLIGQKNVCPDLRRTKSSVTRNQYMFAWIPKQIKERNTIGFHIIPFHFTLLASRNSLPGVCWREKRESLFSPVSEHQLKSPALLARNTSLFARF